MSFKFLEGFCEKSRDGSGKISEYLSCKIGLRIRKDIQNAVEIFRVLSISFCRHLLLYDRIQKMEREDGILIPFLMAGVGFIYISLGLIFSFKALCITQHIPNCRVAVNAFRNQ